MSIDDRYRDKNGLISRKHGNTLVSALQDLRGQSFAAGKSESVKLSDVFTEFHERCDTISEGGDRIGHPSSGGKGKSAG
jgi:hypothetical protein